MLSIHQNINKKLQNFHENQIIPNIIFYGPSGSGKSTIVSNFLNLIYNNNNEHIRNFVMNINCAHGKGIKFIREDLKLFSKNNVSVKSNVPFKIIILLNADKLTVDAQSALRRCIELFSTTTRFFIIIEDKYKLLKPILSRFCDLYIPYPIIDNEQINLHKYNLNRIETLINYDNDKDKWLRTKMTEMSKNVTQIKLCEFSKKLYDKGYSGLDLINYIETKLKTELNNKYEILIAIYKIKKELRNETFLMFFILNYIFIRSSVTLENISFM